MTPGRMRIEMLDFVAGAQSARGVAVIIDVFRAFTVACHAFANGAARVIPLADAEEARRMKQAHPDYLTIGERHARKLEGFDFGNSPTEIEGKDFRGRTIVHTTHAGTQGLVNATGADVVLAGSLVNASALARYIRTLNPSVVSLVRMGHEARESCDEDSLCAELIAARLRGSDFDVGTVRERLRKAAASEKFFDPKATWAPERDFELCTEVDRFAVVPRLLASGDHPTLQVVN